MRFSRLLVTAIVFGLTPLSVIVIPLVVATAIDLEHGQSVEAAPLSEVR